MTEPTTEQRFQTLLNLSHTMLADAQQGQWEEVVRLEQERRQLMEEFFSLPVTLRSEDLATGIQTILDINRRLIEVGSQYQETLKQERLNTGHAHKAATAYLATQGDNR